MKRIAVMTLLLLCMALPAPTLAKNKAPAADMKGMNHIFLGWVAVNPDDYHKQGYGTEAEYNNVITGANVAFQKSCQGKLAGRTITVAKNKDDVNTTGNDLYVKFSDVAYDHHYRLHISMHFIDLKTNTEIATVPVKIYTAHLCGLVGCLDKELEQVSRDVQAKLGSAPAEEKH